MKQNIIEKIDTCIKLIDDRFLLKHYQLRGISIEQLKLFRDKLTLISESIKNNSFAYKNTNMGKIIIDSWPFDSQLGELIIEIENSYKKLKNISAA